MNEGEYCGGRAVDLGIRVVEDLERVDRHANLAVVQEHHGFVYLQVRG